MTLLFGAMKVAPSELDAMDAEDFGFWLERAKEWGEWQQQAQEDPFR
jgi:hypothetical protein